MRNFLLQVTLLSLLSLSVHAALPALSDLDSVLLRNVRDGFVDYDGIRADPAFDRYVQGLGSAAPGDLTDERARLAFLINAYNALAIRGILDGYAPRSFFGRYTYFKRRKYDLLGTPTTLDALEHGQIAPLGDPRTHFAIVCASISCPRLAARGYTAADLDTRLDAAAAAFANDPTRNRYDANRQIAFLSRIFEWYDADFRKAAGSTQKYLARYVRDKSAAGLLARDGFKVQFVDYDWDLNGVYQGKPD